MVIWNLVRVYGLEEGPRYWVTLQVGQKMLHDRTLRAFMDRPHAVDVRELKFEKIRGPNTHTLFMSGVQPLSPMEDSSEKMRV